MRRSNGPGPVPLLLIAFALAVWFLAHTWRGLLCTFQGDDVMNLYQAWVLPVARLALGNLTPFSTVYRPVGSVFYKAMFWAAGFHPLPYRIGIYALLLLNIALLYRFARLLTGSREAAALAALFGSYHNHLIDLYQNGGAVYDVLCYTFFFSAVNSYITGANIRFLLFALLAINSKEMAVTLAVVLWLYEFVYRPPVSWRGKLPLWIVTIATPIAAVAKTSAGSAFYGMGGYQLHLTWAQWIESTRYWIEGLLFLPYQSLTATGAVLIMLLPWSIVLFVRDRERRKPFLLCAALVWLLPLPVNFIDTRGFFVMYIPLAAWSVIVSQAIEGGWNWLADRLPVLRGREIVLGAVAVAALYAVQRLDRFHRFEWTDPSQAGIRAFASALAQACPPIPRDGTLEVADDPFDKTGWDPTFITRLWTRRLDIRIHRTPAAKSDPSAEHYDCTLAYRDGRFVRQD